MARLKGYFLEPGRCWSFVCAGVMLLSLASRSFAQISDDDGVTLYGCITTTNSRVTPGPITVKVLNTDHKTVTEGSGSCYTITGVKPGIYDIQASNGGSYHTEIKRNQRLNKRVNPVDFVLQHSTKQGAVAGAATNTNGEPLPGAQVILFTAECGDCKIATTVTDAMGLWKHTGLAPESYRLAIAPKSIEGIETVAFVPELIRVMPDKSLALDLKADWRGPQLSVLAYVRDPVVQHDPAVVAHSIGRSIMGTVTDFNGAALPGVTVTATRQGRPPASATSNEEGRFHILNIEPGAYTVTVDAAKGFARFEQENVQVSSSAPSSLAIQIGPQGARETVTVGPVGSAVDTTQNTTGVNVTTEQFSNFPTQRTIASLYSIAATITRTGLRDSSGRDRDPSVGGSSGPENNYILDGVSVTDSAFGRSAVNVPIEFLQEFEIKTGAFGADIGKATGGVFNVITKTGTNEFHGDAFAYFTTRGLVRAVKSSAISFTKAAPSSFSEVDAGFDLGGPIVKDKFWFFGAFNPQRRKNYLLTQTFLREVTNEVTTPFYAGKLTWRPNQNHEITFSTFGDYTKQQDHLFDFTGFGADLRSFRGETQTGGSTYAFRLNSTFTPTFIGEFQVGFNFQRANTIPELDHTLVIDRFAVLRNGEILTPIETNVAGGSGTLVAFVDGVGGSVQRNFVRSGFGFESLQDRDLREAAARLQAILGRHTLKWGLEFARHRYKINTGPTGPNLNFNAEGVPAGAYTIENLFTICRRDGSAITCPDAGSTANVLALIMAGQAPAGVSTAITGPVDVNTTNPFLLLDVVRARSFSQNTNDDFLTTNTESFYIQGDFRWTTDLQINLGVRWDYQQLDSQGSLGSPLRLNSFISNLQPRVGFTWDFTGEGRSKIFANYARYIEAPIPLEVAIRTSERQIQNDFNLNVSRLNGGPGAITLVNFGNLSNQVVPLDPGLKPPSLNEWTAGIEWAPSIMPDLTLGFRGIYRAQDEVIEDGSFDDGLTYFVFNPGRRSNGETAEDLACAGDSSRGIPARCFGPARRYYRALEFSATKRFKNNYQFIASYVYSSLIGNYEGLLREDSGQPQRTITRLFDLVSLLNGHYGRLPNDRPHQIKFDGSYRWPFGLITSASFRAQSGIPFNAFVPHPLYGDNAGFCLPEFSCIPRGTAINPLTGSNRTPTTYNLDFGASFPIRRGETELRVQVDWFNVFNNQRAVRMDDAFLLQSGSPSSAPTPNPFYGTGSFFQFPSYLRFGVKFQF